MKRATFVSKDNNFTIGGEFRIGYNLSNTRNIIVRESLKSRKPRMPAIEYSRYESNIHRRLQVSTRREFHAKITPFVTRIESPLVRKRDAKYDLNIVPGTSTSYHVALIAATRKACGFAKTCEHHWIAISQPRASCIILSA